MRAAILGLLAACGAPAASHQPAPAVAQALAPRAPTPPRPPPAPPGLAPTPGLIPPPVALLGRAGTLHLIVPRATGAACEAWTVIPDEAAPGGGTLAHTDAPGAPVERLRYDVRDGAVWLTGRTLGDGDDAITSLRCDAVALASAIPDGLAIGGARAFLRAEDCAGAVARHARVALDLDACPAPRVTTAAQWRAARTRFEAVLARGGTAFALADDAPTCLPVRARPQRRASRPDLFVGQLATRVTIDGRRATTTYHYEYQPDGVPAGEFGGRVPLIWVVDGQTTFDQPAAEELDGGLLGCADPPAPVEFEADRAHLPDGATLYLTRAACDADARVDRVRRAWIAPEAPDPDAPAEVSSPPLPHLGGC